MSEDAVWAVEEAYDAAWCAGDLDGLLACLTADAVLVNPRGEVAIGTEGIGAALGGFLAGEARGTRHRSVMDRITFVRPDVAVVDAHAVISGGELDGVIEHPFTDIVVRDDAGRWAIAHVRAYQFESRG